MKTDIKNSKNDVYYSGGLAELVSSPSPITYSFFKHWFRGKGSLGKAMKTLGLPYEDSEISILEFIDGELLINLANEEKTLYLKTIFKYKRQKNIHETPRLVVDIKKIFNLYCLINTLRILLVQSKWISNPATILQTAKNLANNIPSATKNMDIEEIDNLLKDKVFPNVIAVGLISEFYNQLVLKEQKTNISHINKYVSKKIAKDDWFFHSIADQKLVKTHKMTFADYMEKYGLRADKDYELTSPRWCEIPKIIKKRIDSYSTKNNYRDSGFDIKKSLTVIIDASISLQLIRLDAKRKALLFVNQLRSKILQKTNGVLDISQLTRDDVITDKFNKGVQKAKETPRVNRSSKNPTVTSGKGMSVWQGNANGIAKNITTNEIDIPTGTIGIFPNASPEFAIQYPKCSGMIFLKGGQTSHGAIVAREFGIPAIIDNKAVMIKDSMQVEINGTTGEWHIK